MLMRMSFIIKLNIIYAVLNFINNMSYGKYKNSSSKLGPRTPTTFQKD